MIMCLSVFAACGDKGEKTETSNEDNKEDSKEDNKEETPLSPAVEALLVTAEAFLARKSYLQYDDQSMVQSLTGLTSIRRAERAKNNPETATGQFNVYTNCTEFVYDVYYYALGIDIVTWTTKLLENYTQRHAWSYYITGEETPEQQQEIFDDFKAHMQPGDILVCRHKGDTGGNTLFYYGDGRIILSNRPAGQKPNYDYTTNTENTEQKGTIMTKKVDEMMNSTDNCYFWAEGWWGISRPLIEYSDAAPTEETVNRVKNMQGIVAEKLSSAPSANTVLPGDDIPFTFQIKNTRDTDATLEIIDTLPEGLIYVSGAETVEGATLKWNTTVPAQKTVKVEYVLKVKDDLAMGDSITTSSTVGGVNVNCRPIFIGKHLSSEQQTKLAAEIEKIKKSDVFGIELAKQVYANAGITVQLDSEDDIINGLYKIYNNSKNHFELDMEGKYLSLLAPTMYGGYQVVNTKAMFGGLRTKGPQVNQLMVGDIVIMTEKGKTSSYMVLDTNRLMSLNKGSVGALSIQESRKAIMATLGNDKFAVIRPAMVID